MNYLLSILVIRNGSYLQVLLPIPMNEIDWSCVWSYLITCIPTLNTDHRDVEDVHTISRGQQDSAFSEFAFQLFFRFRLEWEAESTFDEHKWADNVMNNQFQRFFFTIQLIASLYFLCSGCCFEVNHSDSRLIRNMEEIGKWHSLQLTAANRFESNEVNSIPIIVFYGFFQLPPSLCTRLHRTRQMVIR